MSIFPQMDSCIFDPAILMMMMMIEKDRIQAEQEEQASDSRDLIPRSVGRINILVPFDCVITYTCAKAASCTNVTAQAPCPTAALISCSP